MLFLLVSSFVQASTQTSTADSTCRYGVLHGVWGTAVPSASISSGRFGLPPKDIISALLVRGGESNEKDKLLPEEEEEEEEIDPDEDEIAGTMEVNELMDEEEEIMEDLEEDVPSEADGGVDDWAGDEEDGDDDDDVNAELMEEMNEVTAQFDEDEDDLDTQETADVAQVFREEADVDSGSVEPEKTWETPESSFSREAAIPDQAMDDGDSSAFVDRMELADDEGETDPGNYEVDIDGDTSGSDSVAPSGSSVAQEEAQESTSSSAAEQRASAAPPTEITAVTKEILMKELRYRRSEVERMRPDVAKIAADKRLQRPAEGVPVNWFVAGKATNNRNGLLKGLPKILVPVLVGAIAMTTGISFDLRPSSAAPSDAAPSAAAPSKPTQPSLFEEYEISTAAEDTVEADDDESKATKEPESKSEPGVLPVNEHVNAPSRVHAHSIKPGNPPADVLDVTWLDKAITAVERFLGWEI